MVRFGKQEGELETVENVLTPDCGAKGDVLRVSILLLPYAQQQLRMLRKATLGVTAFLNIRDAMGFDSIAQLKGRLRALKQDC